MVLAFIGPILLCIGLALLTSEISKRRKCSKSTEATIVDIFTRTEAVGRGSYVTYYYPVYEYEIDDKTYRSSSHQCSKVENWFQVGDTATIYYSPYDPNEIVSKRYWGDLIASLVFMIAGIIMLIFFF